MNHSRKLFLIVFIAISNVLAVYKGYGQLGIHNSEAIYVAEGQLAVQGMTYILDNSPASQQVEQIKITHNLNENNYSGTKLDLAHSNSKSKTYRSNSRSTKKDSKQDKIEKQVHESAQKKQCVLTCSSPAPRQSLSYSRGAQNGDQDVLPARLEKTGISSQVKELYIHEVEKIDLLHLKYKLNSYRLENIYFKSLDYSKYTRGRSPPTLA